MKRSVFRIDNLYSEAQPLISYTIRYGIVETSICLVVFTLLSVFWASGIAIAQDGTSSGKFPLGLWFWNADEPDVFHTIAVETTRDGWRATLGSEPATVTHDRGVVSVEGPDGSRFVGELASSGSEIRGYWYQPSSPLGYLNVATPTVLAAVADGRWRGDIAAQPRPFRVFLDIFEDEDAEVSAVIRNPDGNNILGATRFRLVSDRTDEWSLVAGSGNRERRYGLRRTEGAQLLLDYDRFDEPIPLRLATDELIDGYYSRQRRDKRVGLTPPLQLDDGWTVVSLDEAGFDRAALHALTVELASADPRSRRPEMIHSLLVARGGQLVYEEYFFGHDREDRHDVRSLGKVFGSVMIGALHQQGHSIDAAHRPIPDVFERGGLLLNDPRKSDITLGHLMTYTSGLDCSEDSDSPGSESRMWEQQGEKNYWLYTARLAMLHEPGERYAYCSGSANLVGASLHAFGGAPVLELFDQLIARPLRFGPYHFAMSPNGEGYLGGGAYVRPRDILKIGAIYLENGTWNGEQIVDEDWIKESTTPRIEISPETTGLTSEEFGDNYFGGSQAYIWRVDTIRAGVRSYAYYEASGNGGQLLIIIPELDLSVVFTGGNYRMGGIWGRWRNDIIGGHIIPAMTELP